MRIPDMTDLRFGETHLGRTEKRSSDYDLRLPSSLVQAQPTWFAEIPWHRSGERDLSDDTIATIEYMDLIEGHVCAGLLASRPCLTNRTR